MYTTHTHISIFVLHSRSLLNTTCRVRVVAQHCLGFTLDTSLFQENPSLRAVRRHLTGNNISAHGRRLLSYDHASEFGVHNFPSAQKPNTTCLPHACGPWNPITQMVPACSFTNATAVTVAEDGKVVSNNCSCCYGQTVVLHPENASRPSARQIQRDSGQWPPQGNIYQLLHLDPVALTLHLLPWHSPFTLNLLNLAFNDNVQCCQG